MNRLTIFYEKYQNFFIWIIAITIIAIAVIIAVYLCNSYLIPNYCKSEIIGGFFLLSAALITAIFAIHKYQSEQRASRLQKVYFEDTLYGQAKILEMMMSQTTKNYMSIESFFNLSINLIDQKDISVENKIKDLAIVFDSTIRMIDVGIDTTDFKKETISKLLSDAKTRSVLPNWIGKFEADTYRFSAFLQGQITKSRSHLDRLSSSNLNEFVKFLKEISKYIQNNYLFIKRHYILFNLFSELVLEFVTVHYTNKTKIFDAFNQNRIKKVIKLINDSYKDVIIGFDKVDIGKLTEDDAVRLSEKIKFTEEKIFNELY